MIGLLSDIHGNLEALHACLKHLGESGATRYAFLGDFIGYGADPDLVTQIAMEHVARGAIAVKGNHDFALEQPASYLEDSAKEAIDLARARLSEAQKQFLADLPFLVREPGICFVHASAADPERWNYVHSPSAAVACADASASIYTFCGHLHEQRLYFESRDGVMSEFRPTPGSPIPMKSHRRWVAVVGSVGQPRDRVPAAACALFAPERGELTFFRVPYDQITASRKIRAAGLPLALARRVELGI